MFLKIFLLYRIKSKTKHDLAVLPPPSRSNELRKIYFLFSIIAIILPICDIAHLYHNFPLSILTLIIQLKFVFSYLFLCSPFSCSSALYFPLLCLSWLCYSYYPFPAPLNSAIHFPVLESYHSDILNGGQFLI